MLDLTRLERYYERIFLCELDYNNSLDKLLSTMDDFNVVGNDTAISTGFISGNYGQVQTVSVKELRNPMKQAEFITSQNNRHVTKKQPYIRFIEEPVRDIVELLLRLLNDDGQKISEVKVTFKPDKNPHKIFQFDVSQSFGSLLNVLLEREAYFADRYAYFDFDLGNVRFRMYKLNNDCYISGNIPFEIISRII